MIESASKFSSETLEKMMKSAESQTQEFDVKFERKGYVIIEAATMAEAIKRADIIS